MKYSTITLRVIPFIVIYLISIIPSIGDTYVAQSGKYIEGTVAKYIERQNITVFRYTDDERKKAYFALVGKYGFSVRTTLGEKIGSFEHGGPKQPRTVTKYRIYQGRIIGDSVSLTSTEHTKTSDRTAHQKLLAGDIFSDQEKLNDSKKSTKKIIEVKKVSKLEDVLTKHRDSELKLKQQFNEALKRLENNYIKEGDQVSANAVTLVIESQGTKPVMSGAELNGTIWNFSNKEGKLARFEFLSGGKIESEKYDDPRWTKLSSKSILFQYGNDGAWIVFNYTDKDSKKMSGFHSILGTRRYLKQIK